MRILIVEDQFIEANALKQMLQRAGYIVCGIARSFREAEEKIRTENPSFVLVDIFLKGELTGIDLAWHLRTKNIPFVYLSANSNKEIMEAAKTSGPSGFLVKPFRQQDILSMLDIAMYRHSQDIEWSSRQQVLLKSLLAGVQRESVNLEEKCFGLTSVLLHFIPFDHLFIDFSTKSKTPNSFFDFERLDFERCGPLDREAIVKKGGITKEEFHRLRFADVREKDSMVLDGQDFLQDCAQHQWRRFVKKTCGAASLMWIPFTGLCFEFFSRSTGVFSKSHLDILLSVSDLLPNLLLEDGSSKSFGKAAVPISTTRTKEIVPSPDKAPLLSEIVGQSPALLHVFQLVNQVAGVDSSVLITGETGTGKEKIAEAIHSMSPRKDSPLVRVNCGAIPIGLVESELFGHEKGAFTGATERRIGKFELAKGGSIFLDEIGDVAPEIQIKLLRVLQQKEIERIGSPKIIQTDVRVIAATNKDLYKEVAEGRFRIDLYYRIHVFPIQMPPLRERREDIPLLAQYFLARFATKFGIPVKTMATSAIQQLIAYEWPGNIRELEHTIERHILITRGMVIERVELPQLLTKSEQGSELHIKTIPELEKAHILEVLGKCGGKIAGPGGAAEKLRMPASSLAYKLKKLGIVREHIVK